MSSSGEFAVHPASLPVDMLTRECRFSTTRRSGPGGQHRNKTDSAVIVEHVPSGIRCEANEWRSQHANRQAAIGRLRIQLAVQLRVDRPSDVRSTLWNHRVSSKQIEISSEHDDFPSILAEALDILHLYEYSLPNACGSLEISTSQIVKLLKKSPAAWTHVNRQRHERGLGKLS